MTKVIVVNGTNPNTDDIIAQIKETGCANLMFTGIGKTKAQKLVDSMPRMKIRFCTFRRLADANIEYISSKYNIVSTIGDFCKGKGRKVVQKKVVETNPEESKRKAEVFASKLEKFSFEVLINGYSYFKEAAKEYGAEKTLRRRNNYYAYFGKYFVKF